MIENPTTLVLGAGASIAPFELGRKFLPYPTGAQLREWIIAGRGQEPEYGDLYRQLAPLRTRFAESSVDSIDAFLAEKANRPWEEAGRLAIAAALLQCESVRRADFPSWYTDLFNAIRRRKPGYTLFIVTFNYDISIECFLFHAFKATYNLTNEGTKRLFNNTVFIVHVYGQLGELKELGGLRTYGEWFGREVPWEELEVIADGIKLIGRKASGDQFKIAHQLIEQAAFLAILGFGYEETNVRNLKLAKLTKGKRIFSTGYDMGPGLRGWIQHAGLSHAVIGQDSLDVGAFLKRSAFFKWVNTPDKTAEHLYDATVAYQSTASSFF